MSLRMFSLVFFVGSLVIQMLPYKLGLLPEFNIHYLYGHNGLDLLVVLPMWLGIFVSLLILLYVMEWGDELLTSRRLKMACIIGQSGFAISAGLVLIFWITSRSFPGFQNVIGMLLLYSPPMIYMYKVERRRKIKQFGNPPVNA